MLEHHIQHLAWIFVLEIMSPIYKYQTRTIITWNLTSVKRWKINDLRIFIDELRWNFEIWLVSLQMAYIHNNMIVYDWIEDLYAWDMMNCMKMSKSVFCEKYTNFIEIEFYDFQNLWMVCNHVYMVEWWWINVEY
jgi:hypothetical protein